MDKEIFVNQKDKKLLKEIRKDLKLTQSQLAEQLGMPRSSLSELETGREIPEWLKRAIKLQRILKQGNYSLEDLQIPDDN